MLFKPEMCQAILDGRKGQTRRLVKPYETARILERVGRQICGVWVSKYGIPPPEIFGPTRLLEQRYRRKWIVGRAYAIQPGRGKKAVGRFLLLSVRREQVQDITPSGILAEGIDNGKVYYGPGSGDYIVKSVGELRHEFVALWNSLHIKLGTRWTDDPEVWVLELEPVSTLKEA